MRTTPRTRTGTPSKALFISLSIAAGLVGCGPPPGDNTGQETDPPPVVLAKDPSVPLLILARKKTEELTGEVTWCPEKVVSVAVEQCPTDVPMTSDHTACRGQGQPIRWFAHDVESHQNPGFDVNFDITFKTSDPLAEIGKARCAKSANGALDCRIKRSAEPGGYEYTVTMSGGPACALDPRIYVNKYTLDEQRRRLGK